MQYEFLKQFTRRMKHVGMYALLLQNSMAKQTWKQFGFMTADEQINLIFAVMLYIMEQSLREVRCTMDVHDGAQRAFRTRSGGTANMHSVD